MQSGEADRGILICGSGVGMCIAVNKLHGIRASVAHDVYSAHQGVEHDDMNVLCLGSQTTAPLSPVNWSTPSYRRSSIKLNALPCASARLRN